VELGLKRLMRGDPDWLDAARAVDARLLFWGRREEATYPDSGRPWETEGELLASGPWGSLYELALR
jgi:hypothetical protein